MESRRQHHLSQPELAKPEQCYFDGPRSRRMADSEPRRAIGFLPRRRPFHHSPPISPGKGIGNAIQSRSWFTFSPGSATWKAWARWTSIVALPQIIAVMPQARGTRLTSIRRAYAKIFATPFPAANRSSVELPSDGKSVSRGRHTP